jgi:hypothetical protein
MKVVYDPNYIETNEYNINSLRVVDISEEQDFTVEFSNGQTRTLLDHNYPGEDDTSNIFDSTGPLPTSGAGNGIVGIYVVNELTTPNSTVNNDIQINVYVSMADDFEVFMPEEYFNHFVFQPQSGFEPQSGEQKNTNEILSQLGHAVVPDGSNTEEPNAPQQEKSVLVSMETDKTPDINKIYTGERIASFRTMLKRYNQWNVIASADNNDNFIFGRFPMFPYPRGNVTNAFDTAAGPTSYNFVNTVLLHWVRYAFQGWKGSIRYKFIPRGQANRSDDFHVQRSKYSRGATSYFTTSTTIPVYSDPSAARQAALSDSSVNGVPSTQDQFSGITGQAIAKESINGVMEVEIPYLTPYRFSPGKQQDFSVQRFEGAYDYRTEFFGNSSAVRDIHVSTGEDFQVFFWTGLPRMYYEANPPASA